MAVCGGFGAVGASDVARVVGAGVVGLAPDAVVGADAELFHVALGAVVVCAYKVTPRLLIAILVHVF